MSDINKEVIYDERIEPLMAAILQICEENKIAMVASFSIPTEDSPDMLCTSALLGDEYEPPPEYIKALRAIRNARGSAFAIITQTPKDAP